MAITLEVFDRFGNKGGTINGVNIVGPLKGYQGLSYTPRGACINKPGTCSFALPMTIRNNYPLVPGAMVFLNDTRYGEQGLFVVGDKSESVSADGHTAHFTCIDLVEELRWPDVPGFTSISTGELLSNVFRRLVAIQDETTWTATLPPALDVTLYDNRYTCDGITVQQAVGQLAAMWFLKWRRGAGRVIELGTLGRDTGIRLIKPSMRPAAMNRDLIRPIQPNGIAPVTDAAGIVNCLVGLGAGDGWAQVSLRDLYNPVGETAVAGTTWYKSGAPASPWVGYDPAYPIYKRYRYDGGNDGFQYFLIDQTSIGLYRKRFARLHTDIGVVSGNPLDLQAAAADVWALTVNKLKLFSAKHQSMTITTTGRGNNVGIGGDLVRVEYAEVTNGVTTMDVNGPFVVVDCVRSVDDATGAYTDRFDVSSLGRAAETDAGIQTGMLQDLQSMRNAATVYPSGYPIWIDAPITQNDPIQVPWDEDRGRLATVEATFTVTCYPLYSTVTGGQVTAHSHPVTIPGQTIDASVPYKYEQSYNPTGQAAYGHAENISANRSGAYGENISANRSGGYGENISANRSGGYGENISANRSGSVGENIGVNRSGGVSENIGVNRNGGVSKSGSIASGDVGGLNTHTHGLFIQGGGTPGSGDAAGKLDTGGFLYSKQGDGQLRSTHYEQTIARTGQNQASESYSTGHGHGDTIGVSDTLGVGRSGGLSDGLGVGRSGGLSDGLGVYKGGGLSDGLGVYKGGGLSDGLGVYKGGGLSDGLGVYRGGVVSDHSGIQPDSRFPGHSNYPSYAQTIQTSAVVAPGFVPVYGKFTSPLGAAQNIRIFIDGVQIFPADNPSGVYATSFVVNLTPYLQGQQARIIEFRSETPGRLLIRGKVRTRVSIVRYGA